MDKEKFRAFVEENCQWTSKDYIEKYKPKTRDSVDHNENSMAWKCIAREQTCPDCLDVVSGRVVQIKIVHLGTSRQRWEKKCSICKKYLSLFDRKK